MCFTQKKSKCWCKVGLFSELNVRGTADVRLRVNENELGHTELLALQKCGTNGSHKRIRGMFSLEEESIWFCCLVYQLLLFFNSLLLFPSSSLILLFLFSSLSLLLSPLFFFLLCSSSFLILFSSSLLSFLL